MPISVTVQRPRQVATLSRGRLELEIDQALIPPESLFTLAERVNPKRAFLFVSRVLGRHVPVRPSVFSAVCERLAAQVPADLPGPVLVLGLAETATGLGAGVHRALARRREDCLYMVSTRHALGTPLLGRFEEAHSHASRHLLHWPVDVALRARLLMARSVVMVDDELSTGRTLINLYRALVGGGLERIEQVVACSLTDWSGDAVRRELGEQTRQVAMLHGRYRFEESAGAVALEMPVCASIGAGPWPLRPDRDWGRLGVIQVADDLAPGLRVRPGERVLVLGTGEFVWKPFLLAERLECAGADVRFAATSRSPIALGHGIEQALTFSDNYGLGLPNFLYNVNPDDYDRVLLCSETPASAVDPVIVRSLRAEVIVTGEQV